MKASLISALITCCLVLTLNQTSLGQNKAKRTPASVAAESSDREQDGLNGPVRRVRVETAKISVKDGNLVEGPRVLSEIATYDPRGTKIDSVAYPVEASTLPGKQEYRYDDNGNIVEMILRGDDGAALSKETYKYELDELDNWKKMTSSVAIYEDGKVSYEPIEVTYRTIAYYYGQAVDKLALSGSKREVRSQMTPPTTPASILPTTSATEGPTASRVSTLRSPSGNSSASFTENIDPRRTSERVKEEPNEGSSPAVKTERQSKPAAKASDAGNAVAETAAPDKAPTAPAETVVKRVTERDLRAAAIKLPEPDYTAAAGVAQAGGKVEVQVIVGENGKVLNARATSGHPLLIDAAETAALNASFSRTKLSSDPGPLFGIITYDFKPPESKVALLATSDSSLTENPKNKRVELPSNAASSTTPNVPPPAAGSNDNSASSLYEKGLSHLAAGRYPEAVEALRQSIRLNPNDAETYLKLGFAYSEQGQHKETLAALKMAKQIKPEALDAQGYYHLGHAYAGLGKYSNALESFKQALYIRRAEAVDPSQGEAENSPPLEELHLGIGTTYYNLRRHRDAIVELKEAITANPKLAQAYYVLSLSYLAVGDRTSAANLQKTLRSLDATLAERIDAAFSNRLDILLPCRNVLGLCK